MGNAFGDLLRHWRRARGLSQLALATEADISIRHLSFLETGRAQPSRDMVQRLGRALDIPLGDRNALLLAGGYAPAYGERALGEPELAPVRRALEFILRQQEPYPALVLDGQWNVVMRNGAARRIFAPLLDPAALSRDEARNALRATFHPRGLRRFIANWEELGSALIQTLHRDAAVSEALQRLRDELLAYPGVPRHWTSPHLLGPVAPLLTMRLRAGDLALAFFTTLTALATPQDITLQQLRIECFHPADARTEAEAARLAREAGEAAEPGRRR